MWKIIVRFVIILIRFSVSFAAFCEIGETRNNYVCNGIVNKFPNSDYGIRELNCLDCNITILKPELFGSNNVFTYFNLSQSRIKFIEPMTFTAFQDLRYLYLDSNKIENIPPDVFYGLKKLYLLNMSNNQIQNLEKHFLNGFESISLYLNDNKIKEITPKVFEGISSILELNLSNNKISILHKESFEYLELLEILDISHNHICYLPLGIFKNLPILKDLNLSHNKLSSFTYGEFSGMRNLKSLNLGYNSFEEISERTIQTLASLTSLIQLELSGIKGALYLDTYTLVTFVPTLKNLILNDNQWGCRELASIIKFLNTRQIDPFSKVSNNYYEITNINGIACSVAAVPKNLNFEQFLQLAKTATNTVKRYC